MVLHNCSLGGRYGQDHHPVSVSDTELHLACSFVSWFPVLMCARLGSRRWIVGSWSLSRVHVFVAYCASWLCAVLHLLELALRMPLRTFVGRKAIVRA